MAVSRAALKAALTAVQSDDLTADRTAVRLDVTKVVLKDLSRAALLEMSSVAEKDARKVASTGR